jgi:NTE family protein
MEALDKGWCLVLSGGGAKGVYHIGMWRALRELGIRVDAFIGTSIGAIIAALLAQGAYDELEEIGRTIDLGDIVSLPEDEGDARTALREFLGGVKARKGIGTEPLRRTLERVLDEAAIRRSGHELGLVTVGLPDLKPVEIFLDAMPEGRLVDYLMASSAFPGFEQPIIEGRRFLDGGLYDNIPYALARRRGWKRVIVSDISGMGRNRKPDIDGGLTVYIRRSIKQGSVFDFSPEFIQSFTKLGYLDTLRTFGRYEGVHYFVEPDPAAEADWQDEGREAGRGGTRPALPSDLSAWRCRRLARLECAALSLGVERLQVYSYAALEAAIVEQRLAVEARLTQAAVEARGSGGLRKLTAMVQAAVSEEDLGDCPYFYWRLVGEFVQGAAGQLLHGTLAGLVPELPAGADWLERR